jgi:hypothetical protein
VFFSVVFVVSARSPFNVVYMRRCLRSFDLVRSDPGRAGKGAYGFLSVLLHCRQSCMMVRIRDTAHCQCIFLKCRTEYRLSRFVSLSFLAFSRARLADLLFIEILRTEEPKHPVKDLSFLITSSRGLLLPYVGVEQV